MAIPSTSPPATGSTTNPARLTPAQQWHDIPAGEIPIVLLVRAGRVIPRLAVAQSTAQLDWKNIELHAFGASGKAVTADFALPDDAEVHSLTLAPAGDTFELKDDPYRGQVTWRITK